MSVQWPAEIHVGLFPQCPESEGHILQHCLGEDIETQGGFPGCAVVEKSPANAGALGDRGSIPGLESRKWQPTLVFLPGESHGQRSLAGYSPWGCKEFGHD